MRRLIVNLGEADEREVPLQEGSYVIGRSRENEIHVPHRSLSRSHARLEVGPDSVVLHDLGSKNGIRVGGVAVREHHLLGGQSFRCGSIRFTFLAGDEEERETAEMTVVERGAARGGFDVTRVGITDLLGGGARHTPTALNLRIREETPETSAKLRILLKVSQLLSSPRSLGELLEEILDLTFEILDVDRAAILLLDEAKGELEEKVVRLRPGLIRGGRIYSENIVRLVVRSGTAALIHDASTDSRLDAAASILQQSICASMCAPFKPREKVLGVLYVDNVTQPDRFNDEDLQFLTAFANQAALAIDNAFLYRRLEEEAVKRNNLLRFFPKAAIDRLLEEDSVSLAVRETEVTALFADITGFTALSSKMPPRRVVEMLNRFFPVMADVVFRHQGTLEKYIGDALLAVWGAPYRREDDARRAAQAAVDMQRGLEELNRQNPDEPQIRIHVGLNTGEVAAGNIGAEHYLQYATVGNTTNVASRVCNAAAAGEILLTHSTFLCLDDTWPLTKLPPVEVKGKDRPMELYRLDWRSCR